MTPSESPALESQTPADPGKPVTLVTSTPPVTATCYLSIVIPAYNEEKRLPATLERIAEYLSTRDLSYEVLIVDDGSRDTTRDVARDFASSHSWVRLVQYDDDRGNPVNRGKGYAIRQGVLASAGRDVLFSDADLSTPIEEMEKLLPPIARGECDIAIASRALPESDLAIHQPFYREWMGRTFNKIVQRIIGTSILDTQCGFKAFQGDAARRLFALAHIDGFGFDTEIIYLARKLGYRVEEIGVIWRHKDDSRVNPILAPISMLSEVVEVRLNDIRGLYEEKSSLRE